MEQQDPPIVTRDTCSRNEQGSGFTVQRESSVRGVETPPPSDPQGVAEIQPGCRRSLRITRRRTMSPVLLSITVRVPSVEPDRADTKEDPAMQTCNDSVRAILAGENVGCGDCATAL